MGLANSIRPTDLPHTTSGVAIIRFAACHSRLEIDQDTTVATARPIPLECED